MLIQPDELVRLRLFLRDKSVPFTFDDDDIDVLYAEAGTVEGAIFMGWLLKAADASDQNVSESIGNTSESFGQPSETFRICMSQANYWKNRDEELNGADWGVGRWMQIEPDTATLVAELLDSRNALESYLVETGDLSA